MKQKSLRLIIIVALLSLGSLMSAVAQDQRVTLKLTGASLGEVFAAVEQQTTYRFAYRDATVSGARDVSINVSKATVGQVLDKALAGKNLQWRIVSDKTIVISDKAGKTSRKSGKTRVVNGTVRDVDGEPLPGASVKIKGTGDGVATDAEGRFTIAVPEKATLVVSYIGCLPSEVSAGGGGDVRVTLRDDATMLAEVVAVGYGTQRREELSSSVASVGKDQFVQIASPDAAALIRGKVAGLTVVQADGDPLSLSQIQLRGITTLWERHGAACAD